MIYIFNTYRNSYKKLKRAMSTMPPITTKTIITRICWIAINLSCLSMALKDVHITIPTAVKRGDNARLTCRYDLEQDSLYSIKWYKGNREFYRYTPRENPPMKVFSVSGITVERSMSNASNVMLTSVEPTFSGKYKCEVSADAPSFHTIIVAGDLEVVDLPKSGPIINSYDRIYSIGDILTANCSLSTRRPLANLTWLINNQTAHLQQTVRYSPTKNELTNLETSALGLKLVLQPKHFRRRNLTLSCRANIYSIYQNVTEKNIELDATSNQIMSDEFNMFGTSRHTQSEGDGFIGDSDRDIKMNHIKAPEIKSNGNCSKPTLILPSLLLAFLLLIRSLKIVSFLLQIIRNCFQSLQQLVTFKKQLSFRRLRKPMMEILNQS